MTGHFDDKVRALLAHDSQHPDPDRLREPMRDELTPDAADAGLGRGRLVERFAVYPVP